jgi:feruloyl esterase
VRSQRLQSLFPDRSIVLRFSIVALIVSVLLLSAKPSLFESSAIAQIPMQPMPSNPCSALIQRDFAAMNDAPTAIVSAQIVSYTAHIMSGRATAIFVGEGSPTIPANN